MIEAIRRRRKAIAQLCKKYNVAYLDMFGSATQPERFDPARSDIDFVVEFAQLTTSDAFQRFMGFKMALERLLGRPVDLLMARSIRNPYRLQIIERQRVRLYAL
jgi:predicted nucleotidyltransferase